MNALPNVCARCSKTIKGRRILVVPSNLEIQLGIAKVEAFHPGCTDKASVAR